MDEEGQEEDPSVGDLTMHFISLFWKVLFALVPPRYFCNIISVIRNTDTLTIKKFRFCIILSVYFKLFSKIANLGNKWHNCVTMVTK